MKSSYRTGVLLLTLVLVSFFFGSCVGISDRGIDVPPGVFRNLESIAPDLDLSLPAEGDWYKDALFYHIWVNAFHDSTGNGIGDIPGITLKLDYLQELGVTGLWLSPFFKSASQSINLHMYDTTDHYTVDPRFGTEEDVEELLAQAHARGMRVIFDWVPNHVSSSHPWFLESSRGDTHKADWFVWRDTPGNQRGPWGQQVWHSRNNKYYYGVFWGGMPDINFRNVEAKDAITNTAIYWLNKGFDGLRIDAVKYLYEDRDAELGRYENLPETIEYFQEFREQILDEFGNLGYSKFMVGENWTDNRSNLERYMYDQGRKAFHMTLDFPFATALAGRNTAGLHNHWQWLNNDLFQNGWMGTFLSNHDDVVRRPATLHRDEALLKAVTAVQLMGLGTPFLYYGNEVGMPDVPQPAGQGHEDRRHRQPFQWELVDQQTHDSQSLLNWHRDLGVLRNSRESLRRGDYSRIEPLASPLFAFQRWVSDGSEGTLVIAHLGSRDIQIDLPLAEIDKLLFSSPGYNPQGESPVLSSGTVAVYSLISRIGTDSISAVIEPRFYLRGNMNGWSASSMDTTGAGSSAQWLTDDSFYFSAGSRVEFKFTFSVDSTSWEDDHTFGHTLVEYVQVPGSVAFSDEDFSLGDYDNIVFQIPREGNYRWIVLQDEPKDGGPIRWSLLEL